MAKKRGKKLADIPEDSDEEIDSKELEVLNTILSVKKKAPDEYNNIKTIFYATAIFAILSLPFTDRILELALPMANSWLVLVGLKTVIFFILYYTVQKVLC